MSNIELQVDIARVFIPLEEPGRYKGAYGGRGSGKSWYFANKLIRALVADQNKYAVCIREVQSSIKMSVKRLLEIQIQMIGAESYFTIQESQIKCNNGEGVIIFQGMQNHTADSIKSLESFDICWCEESQSLSQRSLDLLRPTIRKEDSEMWFSWNPRFRTDPIDVLLRPGKDDDGNEKILPKGAIVIQANYHDNPWLSEVLWDEMDYCRRHSPEKYTHIWLGEYEQNSEARVFKNYKVHEFTAPSEAMFSQGADWGYSKDPTVLIRSYITGRDMWIDYEAYQIGCEIMDIPDLFAKVPQSHKWPICADSARPEIISYLKKNGFPKIYPAAKGRNSVYEGVMFLQSYFIHVHPRCIHTIDELALYSWKIDPMTGLVTNILADKKNHVIDGLRYGNERGRKTLAKKKRSPVKAIPVYSKWSKINARLN